ncbi:MAG: FKBP-type peptidyl-prolyl cis-trans isomerase [Acidobacteria bacterium]|nr:FKBP-type peptidyl-prolyl cis-trans isomerase [Acidobacteriota bacterium]
MNRTIFVVLTILLVSIFQLACQNSSTEVSSAPAATPQFTATPTAQPSSGPGEMKTTPTGLKYQDLVLGTGQRPLLGQTVTVKYVGKLADGKVFEEGKFDFRLGEKDIIRGFTLGIGGGEGIDAMKLDGKRLIIVPPELGYGNTGNPPKVPPNATISYEMELVKVQGGLGF